MPNNFKSAPKKQPKRPAKGRLSLYPLSLETALAAALQTGGPLTKQRQMPVKKGVEKRKS